MPPLRPRYDFAGSLGRTAFGPTLVMERNATCSDGFGNPGVRGSRICCNALRPALLHPTELRDGASRLGQRLRPSMFGDVPTE